MKGGSLRRAGSSPRAEARAGERRDNPAQPCELEGHCLKENKQQKEHISAETPIWELNPKMRFAQSCPQA